MNQLTSSTRSDGHTQQWNLDGLRNGLVLPPDGQSQARTFDSANELTAGTGMATPAYDAAGT